MSYNFLNNHVLGVFMVYVKKIIFMVPSPLQMRVEPGWEVYQEMRGQGGLGSGEGGVSRWGGGGSGGSPPEVGNDTFKINGALLSSVSYLINSSFQYF
jgi:hypothetical protein